MAVDANGRMTHSLSKNATRWCLVGALERCYPVGTRIAVADRVRKVVNSYSLSGWNDNPARSFEDVRKALIEADV